MPFAKHLLKKKISVVYLSTNQNSCQPFSFLVETQSETAQVMQQVQQVHCLKSAIVLMETTSMSLAEASDSLQLTVHFLQAFFHVQHTLLFH